MVLHKNNKLRVMDPQGKRILLLAMVPLEILSQAMDLKIIPIQAMELLDQIQGLLPQVLDLKDLNHQGLDHQDHLVKDQGGHRAQDLKLQSNRAMVVLDQLDQLPEDMAGHKALVNQFTGASNRINH